MKAAIYVRISSDKTGKAAGVRRQEKECRELAASRRWTVAEVFTDNDISAYSGKRRPVYDAMLDAVRRGDVGAIVAWHTDRLYRRVTDLEALVKLIEATDVRIATVTAGDFDLSTSSGRGTARILAAVGQMEVEHTGDRQRARWAQRKADGKLLNLGKRPFGYRRKPGSDRLTLVPNEAAAIRDAAQQIINGSTVYRVCMTWRETGVRTPNCVCSHGSEVHAAGKCAKCGAKAKDLRDAAEQREALRAARHTFEGRIWMPAHIRRMLMTDLLVGGPAWPPILTEDEHALVLARLKTQSVAPGGRPAGRRYALNGMVVCGLCGAKLQGSSGAYRCTPNRSGCGKLAAQATPLEQHVLLATWLRGQPDGITVELGSRPSDTSEDTSPLLKELREVEDRIARAQDDYADGAFDVAGYTRITRRLEARREDLLDQVARATPALAAPQALTLDDVNTLRERWGTRDLKESEVARLQDFLAAKGTRVVVNPGRARHRKFDPNRVEVTWQATV